MYLLDTSTLAELLRTKPPVGLIRRLSHVPTHERWTSVVTVGQLLIAARHEGAPKLMQDVVRLVAAIRVAPFDLSAAQSFAKLRAGDGAQLDTDDVIVAAIAISRDMALVTRRREVFTAFDELRLEDWTTA
ncbi:MAG TPA: type II toxin-antitoxin system VapC family toxin [Polyangiaceae bacterium]|nr:type II toxin-antitoxin system VapC family toxin [Polyangiaceae bacterium]